MYASLQPPSHHGDTSATSSALDTRDLDFLRHLPETSDPHHHHHHHPAADLQDHDWGTFESTLALTPRGATATASLERPVLKTEPVEEAPPATQPLPPPAQSVTLDDDVTEPGDGPLPKRSKWTRRLVITKQPASEFYKDEGGKANALDVEVSLIEFNELGESARSPDDEFIDIPLRILLFFEDGKRVDDADQDIFRFVGNEYDSVVIRASTRKAAVQFRLEKVSRRKDGKRFRLRIEVDQEQCTANVADLSPIFTNAICVLSKRKHHAPASDNANGVKEPPLKLLKRDLLRMDEKLDARVDALMDEMRRMSRQVQLQSELLGKLFMPTAVPTSTAPAPPPPLPADQTTMEWFLKSGLMDDVMARPAHLHLPPHTALPYFHVADDAEERDGEDSSPSSSDGSVGDVTSSPMALPPHVSSSSSVLTFAEF